MSNTGPRTVLITGCSDGGLGAALAIAFHNAGLHVYATARDTTKMQQLAEQGIQTLALDVQSESSIAICFSKVPQLDILINNAGAMMTMPVSDTSILQAKKLFDTNVWSVLAVTQAFLPLLLQSKGIIVNHTSAASTLAVPFGGAYGASKAAAAMFSDTLRLELGVFGVQVVDMKTGIVGPTNLMKNNTSKLKVEKSASLLPANSIYQPAKALVEKTLVREGFKPRGMPPADWSKGVVQDLLKENPPYLIWRGESAMIARIAALLPLGWLDGLVKKATKMDRIEKALKVKQD